MSISRHHHGVGTEEVSQLRTSPLVLRGDDMMVLSEEGEEDGLGDGRAHHRVYSPPAKLAARLYPSKPARRRSSQASSRRNSLTSSHSHHSNRSFRSIHQSNHIAQHLRRNSFIESRKARLQDRAAHAEQVRLRAALAKAAPKVSKTEERSIAAAVNREKQLAKLAATAAEECARAKRVYEEQKAKAAEDERRARLLYEEKHAEADKRRAEHTRVPRKVRSRSSAASEAKAAGDSHQPNISLETYCRRIQRIWRHHRRKVCVNTFMQLELSIDKVKNMGILEATRLLADPNIIQVTHNMMRLLHLETGALGDSSAVRRLLSAYMILGHAPDVFNKNSQQEEDLMCKAKELLISFQSVSDVMASSPMCIAPATQIETLSQAYLSYCSTFEAWKTQDKTVLIETMVAQFVAFDAIWQTVKDDTRGEVANDYRDAIRDQQVILLSKIKKLAGAENANRRIKQAIRESRRQRRQQMPVGETRPRPVGATGRDGNMAPDTASPTAAAEVEAESTAASLPTQDELSRVFSFVPPNRELVHELMIDPTFRIEVSPQSDPRNILNREVCAGMRRAIDLNQGDIWTVAVAENIRKRLLKLLNPGSSMHTMLSEYFDPQMIREKCARGQFSYEDFFEFMADLLPRLCAPFRDGEVKALVDAMKNKEDSLDAMIEKLFGLLHLIDEMSLDYTNYMLSQAAPTLISEGPGYESRMFNQDLHNGVITLQVTKRWWRNATVMTLTESSAHDTPTHASIAATLPRIYARGLTDLAIGTGLVDGSSTPETLRMDVKRLGRIREDSLRYMTVGAILLTAKNLLRRDVRAQWKPEAKRVYDTLRDSDGNIGEDLITRIVTIISATHGMPQSSHVHLSDVTARILSGMRSGRVTDPVLKLLIQRLKAHIFNCLAATTSTERLRVASTTSEGLAGIGLAEFVGQIGALADELTKVAMVDKDAHGAIYHRVLHEIEAEGQQASGIVSP